MSDEQNQQANGGEGVSIAVNAQYIKDFSFENPKAPNSLMAQQDGNKAPDVNVNLNVEAGKVSDNAYEVTLKVSADAKRDSDTVFVVELAYAAIMSIQGVPEEHLQAVLMIEGPRLIFPFARQVIADATREGGFPPLLINPIDFAAMYQQNQQQAQQKQEGNA